MDVPLPFKTRRKEQKGRSSCVYRQSFPRTKKGETRVSEGAKHWKPCSLPFGNFSSSP